MSRTSPLSSDLGVNYGAAHVVLRKSSHVSRLRDNFYKRAQSTGHVTNVAMSEPTVFGHHHHVFIEWDHTARNGRGTRSNTEHDGSRAIYDALGHDIVPVLVDVIDRKPRKVLDEV